MSRDAGVTAANSGGRTELVLDTPCGAQQTCGKGGVHRNGLLVPSTHSLRATTLVGTGT